MRWCSVAAWRAATASWRRHFVASRRLDMRASRCCTASPGSGVSGSRDCIRNSCATRPYATRTRSAYSRMIQSTRNWQHEGIGSMNNGEQQTSCGLAKNFLQLFLARMAVGVGEATLTPSGFSMLGDLFRPHRLSLPVSVFTGSSFVGSGLALLIGGFVIAHLSASPQVVLPLLGAMRPWEAAFVICALPGVVVVALFLLTVREPVRRGVAVDSATTSPPLGEVLVFVRTNAGVFAAVFLGISVLAAVQFCLGAWVPAHFIRNLGWSASQVGYAYGLIFLICGTGGVITGGFIADRLQARGMRDGHLRVAFAAALLTIPFVVSLPMVSTPEMAVMLLAPSIFLGTIPFGAGPALIPVICPARMRGLLVAIYLLIANIVGQAGGPLVVALFTDYVFGSPELVSRSLMVVPAMLLLIGAGLVRLGFKGLRGAA
ncbi:MAG: MFS transporter [Gammaproteobacteria bacterium]|nr:MFS transporter [Gammaproteobacteria bacterium]